MVSANGMMSATGDVSASPAGFGQYAHVAQLATALADRGHEVRIYVRRESADGPDAVRLAERVTAEAVPVGPAAPVPTDDLLPIMGDFGRWLADRWAGDGSASDPGDPPD